MEALLRQPHIMCPFLHKASPATIRSLSSSCSSYKAHGSSRAGVSRFAAVASRCPVMGTAVAVHSTDAGVGGSRACLHTTKSNPIEKTHLRKANGKMHSSTTCVGFHVCILTHPAQYIILPPRLQPWEARATSTMMASTRTCWTRSTRINRTGISIASTA